MDEKNHRLILDGNAFYEIDLTCVRKKEKREREYNEKKNRGNEKRQRN